MERSSLVSIIGLAASVVFATATLAHAQTSGHWCGAVWSSYPCTSADYGYTNTYNYNYPYQYYQSYYPYQNYYGYNQYQYSYPYQYQYTYPYYNQVPSCSITYSYSNNYVYNYNYPYYSSQPVTLSWNSSNARTAYLSNYGQVLTSGSMTITPTQNTTYTLTVSGPGGTNSCSTYVSGVSYQQYYQPYYNQYQYYPYTYYYSY